MPLSSRIARLERALVAIDPTTGAVARRCPTCRDGAKRRWITAFDGVPTWSEDGSLEPRCAGCGRDVAEVVDVRGVNPARL